MVCICRRTQTESERERKREFLIDITWSPGLHLLKALKGVCPPLQRKRYQTKEWVWTEDWSTLTKNFQLIKVDNFIREERAVPLEVHIKTPLQKRKPCAVVIVFKGWTIKRAKRYKEMKTLRKRLEIKKTFTEKKWSNKSSKWFLSVFSFFIAL